MLKQRTDLKPRSLAITTQSARKESIFTLRKCLSALLGLSKPLGFVVCFCVFVHTNLQTFMLSVVKLQ